MYIVPTCIKFIDTTDNDLGKRLKITYLHNTKTFARYLSKAHDTYVLEISYDTLSADDMEITLEINKTDAKAYFSKLYVFVDKRKVRLIFNREKKSWEYASLIKLWGDPQVGKD